MKVIAFTPAFLPVLGGIEVFADALARELRTHSVETIIVTDCDPHGLLPARDVVNGTVVYRFEFLKSLHGSRPIECLRVFRELSALVRDINPDLLHVHSTVQGCNWFVHRLIESHAGALPLIVTQHALVEEGERIEMVRSLLVKADFLTAVSRAARDSAVEFSGRMADVAVIANGLPPIDGCRQTNAERPHSALLCVGRLEHGKGFDLAISALPAIRSAGIDAQLTIIGQGEEREALNRLACELGVADHVRFTGVMSRHDVLAEIGRSSLVIVPSRSREGFSLVAAEAALAGIPCVAARMGGLVDTVVDGKTGMLFTPESSENLAAAALCLLNDEAKMQELSTNAMKIGLQKFDIERCAEAYFRVYREVLDRRRS